MNKRAKTQMMKKIINAFEVIIYFTSTIQFPVQKSYIFYYLS